MTGVAMGTTEMGPGWYPDAVTPESVRYWDGTRWTAHTAVPVAVVHPGQVSVTVGAPRQPMTPQPHAMTPRAPRAPRRRLPLPAYFVVGTVLIGFPLAITVGVLAAQAAAPAPLDMPVAVLPIDAADAAAQKDAAAIGLGIERFYQQTLQGGIAAPTVTVSHENYVLGPVPNGSNTWEWPPIPMSGGVSLRGQNGTAQDDWCVWVAATGGTVQNWQVTADGVTEGTCGL